MCIRDRLITDVQSTEFEENNTLIYPNPTDGELNTSFSFDYLKIYNQMGVMVQDFRKTTRGVDVSGLPSGVYYLYFKSQDQINIIRLIRL